MSGHWDSVKGRVSNSDYGGSDKISLAMRTQLGSALDAFNIDLPENQEAKTQEIHDAINRVQPEYTAKLQGLMLKSVTIMYRKLRNTILYERSLLENNEAPVAPASVPVTSVGPSVYDNFIASETPAAPTKFTITNEAPAVGPEFIKHLRLVDKLVADAQKVKY